MDRKDSGLKRIARLYDSLERMEAAAMERASFAVRQTEQAARVKQDAAVQAHDGARTALSAGDREEWTVMHAQQADATSACERLEELRLKRAEDADAARVRLVASRVQAEQIQSLLRARNTVREAQEARKEQASADDRYLARKRWKASSTLVKDS